jgi:uncharacterized membrane protein
VSDAATAGAADAADTPMWQSLEPRERAALWEEKAPATAKDMVAIVKSERRHAHRMAWGNLTLRFFSHVVGFGGLAILARVAWHMADLGAHTQAALVLGGSAVALVTVFVTGKSVSLGRGRGK